MIKNDKKDMNESVGVAICVAIGLIICLLIWISSSNYDRINKLEKKEYLAKNDVRDWATFNSGVYYEKDLQGRIEDLEKLQSRYDHLEEYLDIELTTDPEKTYYKKGRTCYAALMIISDSTPNYYSRWTNE
mgnify:CR=1 FL=1